MDRNYSKLDRFITSIDDALRISTGDAPMPFRENPAGDLVAADLDEDDRRHVAATAHHDATREAMQLAADEEIDHLSWCEDRLKELDSRPSVLNPLWYAGSFAIGAVAGIAGDNWSLGFVKETENQVEAHLQDHLEKLPEGDARSQAILDQMKEDEAKHADMAVEAGARDLPPPIRRAMTFTADIMKALAYRI